MKPTADMFDNVQSAQLGDIVVVSGLKQARSGDVLLGKKDDLSILREIPSIYSPVDQSLTVPQPVMFASIEAPSLAALKRLDTALECIVREDPSITVHFNMDTGQTVMSGMGDLHLEVTAQRIRSQYGVDAQLGELAISYRELLVSVPIDDKNRLSHEIEVPSGDDSLTVKISASIHVLETVELEEGSNQILLEFQNNLEFAWDTCAPQKVEAIKMGARRGLGMTGPLLNASVTGLRLRFYELRVYPYQNAVSTMITGAIMTCASELIQKLVGRCSTVIMEPKMRVEVGLSTDREEGFATRVLNDLSRRRAKIEAVEDREQPGMTERLQTVVATAPLAELVGYAGWVRKLTSGRADLHLELDCYEPLTEEEQENLLNKMRCKF